MKKLITTRRVSLLLLFMFLSSLYVTTADAQRTKRARRTAVNSKEIVKKGAEDVGIQLKNVTKYVFALGGVATGIEELDEKIRAGEVSAQVRNQNERNKNRVRQSVRDLRAGLIKLEVDFRSKPQLRRYLPQLSGLTNMSYRVEDLANEGRFRAAGKELLLVVEKLTDTLVEMP